MISAYHGIGAYRRHLLTPTRMLRALKECLNGVELCAADRPIGAFGVVVMGDCRKAFSQDVWSDVDADGQRFVDDRQCWQGSIEQPTHDQWEEFAQHWHAEALIDGYKRNYCEAWVSPIAIRAIWIKPWVKGRIRQAAEVLARTRGLPLIEISGQTRIAELLDSKKLPFHWQGKKAA